VLLNACANITGLTLARTSARTHELAVRAALGSGRRRLLRQALAESLMLAVGGAAGVLLARGSMKVLLRLAPKSAVTGLEARLDWFVLLFGTVATLATGLFFGLAPAWQSSRVDPRHALKGGGRAVSGARQGLRSGAGSGRDRPGPGNTNTTTTTGGGGAVPAALRAVTNG
jgi:ABC-type antimicrobial peptide transport system permease subunit